LLNHANVDISQLLATILVVQLQVGARGYLLCKSIIYAVQEYNRGGIKVNLYKVQIFIAVLSLQWRNSCLQNAQRQWNLVYPSKVGMFHAWKYTHCSLHTQIFYS